MYGSSWAPESMEGVLDLDHFYGIKTPWDIFLPFNYEWTEISHLTFVMFRYQRSLYWKASSAKPTRGLGSLCGSSSPGKNGASGYKPCRPAWLHRVLPGACFSFFLSCLRLNPGWDLGSARIVSNHWPSKILSLPGDGAKKQTLGS